MVVFRGYQMFFYCLYVFLFLLVGSFLLTAYGPLNSLLPDFNNNKKRELIDLMVKVDSLESKLLLNTQYVDVINRLFSGEVIDSFFPLIENDTNYNFSSLDLSPSKEDSVLRKIVHEDDRHNISAGYKQKRAILEDLVFFNPAEGLVINDFNLTEKHYGIDVAAHSGASVKSCLDGVVVFADWSVSNGNTIIIQHSENIISLYMHNESLTKANNDFVRAGEVIGFVGNSGENSSGPHLHFELWQRGVPINPVEYISF
ncbi:M23 family metallopeptidase [Flavobacteriales bacterium]|nr:M23 family metallopeptidase [Flavobacteriales bacterium]